MFYVFLQCQPVFGYDPCMGNSYIAEVPRFMADSRYGFPSVGIAFNKTELGSLFPEKLADSLIRKMGADGINQRLFQGKINGEPGLMFAGVR